MTNKYFRSFVCLILALMGMSQSAVAADFKDFSVIVNNQGGTLLTSEEQVQGTAVEFGVAVATDGTVSRVAKGDASSVATISGKFHSEHGCTNLKVVVPVPGAVKITVGQCTYSKSAINVTDADGKTVATLTPSNPACWKNDKSNVDELYYNGGATTLTITGMSYCPFVAVEAVNNNMDNAATTATFPFNLGTEGQTATFGDMDFYFLSSKVTHGANLILKDKSTHGSSTQTRFQPTVANESAASEANAIKFLFRPYPGLVFTPTKISLKSTRYGTDGGKLDLSWINPDGTTVSLATGLVPDRNNKSDQPSTFAYDVTGATPAEGECGLQVNLYSLGDTKQVGFADIVIEGTLTGEKQEIPILASFKANGINYNVDDIFEIVGDDYVANIELFKADKMINSANPLTDIVATAGTVGDVTYVGDDEKTVVTIPVSHNNINMKWIANFVRKPFYTLTYIDTDGKTVIGTQQVEKDAAIGAFEFDGTKVTVASGYAFRGWATANSGSTAIKYTTKSSFSDNTNLYAYTTPIEVASPTARFDYDLRMENFDPADHEMLTFEGTGYWHDKQHGWAFQKGDKIKLELAGKGYIKLSLCQYSGDGELKLLAPDGTTVLGTTANKVSSDGANATIQYDGAQGAGILTLEIPATSYIHSISIRNQAEDPYMVDGDIFVVKRGATDVESGKNLLSMLELANGFSGTDRKIIFLPNGTYDLEETVLTAISRNNISLIGESMEGTIIKNAPDISIEGIGTTATLLNTSTGLYMQDLTLQNALDYYGAQRAGLAGGRAVCLQDKGRQTICKNVKMLSYQDTYYSNANNQFYWEDSEIHGTVDYLCGGGDVYYNGCTFVNESRSAEGKTGSDVITAPYTDASNKFGYVFNNCTIENHAASFSLGRAWGGNSTSVWLNTTINQPKEIIDTRFTLAGMNVAAYKFKEYNSMDTEGNVVSPASLVETFTKDSQKYTYDIILSDEEAAEFTLDKVFTNWAPNEIAKQAIAPAFVKLEGTNLTWEDNKSAKIWAVLKNGSVIDFVDAPSYTVDDATAEYAIRAANAMGGLSSAVVANSYVNVTLASVGYATFYDSKNAYILPAELKAYAVSNANTSELTYTEVGNIIPAGTAVMLESADKTGGEYLLSPTDAKVTYQGTNMLKGSDVATTTFAEQNSLFYKLSFGSSKTAQAGSFGWFWGAADGGAFEIEAHRAWLAIPVLLNTPAISYIIGTGGEGTTAIKNIENKQEATGEYYNLQGQRVDVPTKGLYIHNGKKVIIK